MNLSTIFLYIIIVGGIVRIITFIKGVNLRTDYNIPFLEESKSIGYQDQDYQKKKRKLSRINLIILLVFILSFIVLSILGSVSATTNC